MSSSIKKSTFYFGIIENIALENWTKKKKTKKQKKNLCFFCRVKSSNIKATRVRSTRSRQKMGTSSPLTEFLKAPCNLRRQVWCSLRRPGTAFLPTVRTSLWLECVKGNWGCWYWLGRMVQKRTSVSPCSPSPPPPSPITSNKHSVYFSKKTFEKVYFLTCPSS